MTAPVVKIREILDTLPPSYPRWAVVCVPMGALIEVLDTAEELAATQEPSSPALAHWKKLCEEVE